MPTLTLVTVLSVLAGQEQGGRPAVQLVGAYDSIRTTEEHIYGYELELWRVQGTLAGVWTLHEGLIGDSGVTVQVESLKVDERRQTVSFTARFCDTTQSFEGRLAKDGVTGTLSLRGRKGVFDVLSVDLKPSTRAGFGKMPTDAAEWKSRAARRRGPDCRPLVIGK